MKARVEAGSDIAMIGAWDASRNDSTLTKAWGKALDGALQQDAEVGHIFVLKMGGDAGGDVDVYLDEPVPEDVAKDMRLLDGQFLISVPTGRLVIGGVEDYRSAKARITADNSIVNIPAGDYGLRCRVAKDEIPSYPPDQKYIEQLLGSEDYRYYRRWTSAGCFGFLLLLLIPVLAFAKGWLAAFVITVPTLLAYFAALEWFQKHNVPYRAIIARLHKPLEEAVQKQLPLFLFELRRLSDNHGLRGGVAKIK